MSSKALWCKPLGTTCSGLHPPFDRATQGLTFSVGTTGKPEKKNYQSNQSDFTIFFISLVEEDFEGLYIEDALSDVRK